MHTVIGSSTYGLTASDCIGFFECDFMLFRGDSLLVLRYFVTLHASCGAVYCNRSCLCVCGGRAGGVCLCVCGSVTTITRNCVHRSSPNWVCR